MGALVITSSLIALGLACAVAIVLRRDARIVRRGAASSPSAAADDPFFFPFGEMPTLPRDTVVPIEWLSGGALRRNGSDGCPSSRPGTAVASTSLALRP
jgi:hypothetical protein